MHPNPNQVKSATQGGPSENEIHRFKTLALRYRDFALQAGVELTPFRDESLPLFTEQTSERRSQILEALGVRVDVCEETVAQGKSVSDSPVLVWNALKKLKLRPTSDLFSSITGNRVVEVHSLEGVQLFSNFNYYRYTSYSLEDLYCAPWNELFAHEPGSLEKLIGVVTKIATGEWTTTAPTGIPPHRVSEARSEQGFEILLDMQLASPLFAEGTSTPVASVVLEEVSFVKRA